MKIRNYILVLVVACLSLVTAAQKTETRSKKTIISGIVTDSIQNPIAGAMILIDNKSTNILTDSKGFYKVKVRSGSDLIAVFTFTNGSAEESIAGRSKINLKLRGRAPDQKKRSDSEGNNDRVNIGYGSVEKKDLTTPLNKLEVDADKTVTYNNIYEMIKGRFPSVQVSGKSIQIQGVSSFNLSSEPLLVVDNMIVTSIDDIHPNDVRSIEILKGPSASIYGARGATGVIMIYLKGPSRIK
jgi:TonB-dependent starch-binding outer membrane protein SusC